MPHLCVGQHSNCCLRLSQLVVDVNQGFDGGLRGGLELHLLCASACVCQCEFSLVCIKCVCVCMCAHLRTCMLKCVCVCVCVCVSRWLLLYSTH